jgi:ubiquitin-protein ligase
MNKSNNQLETVLQEVSDYFANTPRITVIPKEGSPPDQYKISYQITGICKESEGDIYSCDNHVISISLPFGFPHFPPNCLPESPTFHPDFDSSAICIGDAWEADKSIVKLILHIGRMISGEIFSKSNAFNSEAAEWYNANTEQLPFDTTDFTAQEASSPSIEEEPVLESIDTLGDEDFGSSFSLEKEIPSPSTVDTDRLRIIAKQKRFQALSRELNTIKEQFEGRTELEEQAQTAMDRAMELFQEADTLEHQGEQQQALDKYNNVEEIVSDYPMLQEAKERVQQAFDLLGDWVNNNASAPEDRNGAKANTEPSLPADQAPKKSEKRTFFEDKKAVSKKLFLLALGGGSIALIAMLIFSYFSLGSSLKKAGKSYSECQTLLDQNNFKGAERKCEEALSLTTEVRMVKQNEKEDLAQKIKSILASPKLQQGLMGKTLFEGKYVSKSTKELLVTFKEAKESGDSFFKQERWDEAANSYTRALDTAKKTTEIGNTLLVEIRTNLPRAQFNDLMQAGKKSLSISDWDDAAEYFGKALKLAKTSPHVLPKDIKQLEKLSNQAEFNSLRDQGHKSFKAGEWDTALSSYQRAIKLATKLNYSDPETVANLKENIAKTKIYMAIAKGKKAFAASQWETVIAQYEKAIILLKENSKLLSKINTEESRVKLSRIMLHAEIIKDKQDIAKYLQSEEYEAVVEKLQHIQQSISTSQFAKQTEFQTILKESKVQAKDAKQQLLLIEQAEYLTENYEKLFRKHYPAAGRSVLSAPKVEFLRNIGDKLLFRMQCTEKAGGRPLRLQMDYLYSPSNGRWRFYAED